MLVLLELRCTQHVLAIQAQAFTAKAFLDGGPAAISVIPVAPSILRAMQNLWLVQTCNCKKPPYPTALPRFVPHTDVVVVVTEAIASKVELATSRGRIINAGVSFVLLRTVSANAICAIPAPPHHHAHVKPPHQRQSVGKTARPNRQHLASDRNKESNATLTRIRFRYRSSRRRPIETKMLVLNDQYV